MYPPSITLLGITVLLLLLVILGIFIKSAGDATAQHEKDQGDYEWNIVERGFRDKWDGLHREDK